MGLKFGAYHGKMADFIDQTDFDMAVFQFRDPRDVALSAHKAGVDDRSPCQFVKHWLDWNRTVRTVTKMHRMPVIEHRFEDLLTDPETVLGSIWNFLGIAPCDDALEFYNAEEQKQAAKTSYMWQNVAKPLQSDNKEKFYSEWGLWRTRAIEGALGRDGMAEFGYRPASLSRFPWRAFLNPPLPERRLRSEEDKEFQRRQNEIATNIRRRWDEMKAEA